MLVEKSLKNPNKLLEDSRNINDIKHFNFNKVRKLLITFDNMITKIT